MGALRLARPQLAQGVRLISAPALLQDCQRLVRRLEDDLRDHRLTEHPELEAPLRAEYQRAREGKRTGQTWGAWRDDYLTQVAVHWVLATVFLRFLEDNELIPEPWISGLGPRRTQAQDRQERFFAAQPAASDRDYLLAAFRDVEKLPAMAPLFDERHNPLFRLGPTADGARMLLDLFRRLHQESGDLVHDFTDPAWSTRFLGDLYQDLSEVARKRYALLQTPEFVEEFILDRTLGPAMAEVGYRNVTLIDPACGSGHFLLGAFHRLFDRWQKDEPGTEERELARRALDKIAGVDLNPFAVAIARFRLVIAALKVSQIKRLVDTPAFPLNLAVGDSLLHGPRPGDLRGRSRYLFGEDPLAHVYETEDANELRRLLGRQYTVVVGNPPYIIPKDSALNEAYRDRFGSCHRQYSLAVPFTERFFDLAAPEESGQLAGWAGMITANSFMKREFGKKLIEQYLLRWDLTYIIDTSGAYIPGHGTPTVILIGRSRPPFCDTIRTVMGVRGEPGTPEDSASGLVWSSIVTLVNSPPSENKFITVADTPRIKFSVHPWSIGGGGASDLKQVLEESSSNRLREVVNEIGFGALTREDEVFRVTDKVAIRHGISPEFIRPLVAGEDIRDWSISNPIGAIWPYDPESLKSRASDNLLRFLWPWRTQLSQRVAYGQNQIARGLTWFEYSMFFGDRYRQPMSLALAFVATHNHFALDRGGKVFKQTAPIIKLPSKATEDDHLALLGLLNSSTACFWMKQTFFDRGAGGGTRVASGRSPLGDEKWESHYEHDSTKLLGFPLVSNPPLEVSRAMDRLAREYTATTPETLALKAAVNNRNNLHEAKCRTRTLEHKMIALQEELDWQVYRLYGLLDDPIEADPSAVPEVTLGERPFEIVLARKMASGEIETKWFERHGSTPITEIPSHWPEAYRQLVERRIKAIEDHPWIALIEQPEYKRRWNREPWEEQEKRALRGWLLDRLEDRRYWPEPRVTSTAKLADRLREDDEFRQVASLYRGRDDFDWTALVTELALEEAVPFLAAYRYTESGQRKRADWEETWRLQRIEDEIDARTKLAAGDPQRLSEDEARTLKAREVGDIPVPPKYASADFRKSSYWRLRGKLDVPKERFIHYPGLERGVDASPVIGWAGWNHLEQAQALGAALTELRENEGWGADRLKPGLAGLLELLPWLLQWHNDPDPAHGGERLGKFFAGFLDEEARSLGLTREELSGWRLVEKAKRGRKRG